MARVGVVVIGRNEARVLARSLRAVASRAPALVYADSDSTDGSPAIAEGLGVAVVRLDGRPPRSAARGRNAGRAWLRQHFPEVQYIQFVDGDTELEPDWIERALDFMERNESVGVVAGRLRERFRDRNVYHKLADMEFEGPAGDVDAVGGIAMYRARAFDEVGGFDPRIVSGEERELCARIRGAGMRVVRLAETMAHHDIQMDSFKQWLVRTKRCGYTAAEHWADRGIMGRNLLSMLLWGAFVPGVALTFALPTLGGSLAAFGGGYGVLWRRVREDRLRRGATPNDAALFATATVLGKLPEAVGAAQFATERLGRRMRARVIASSPRDVEPGG